MNDQVPSAASAVAWLSRPLAPADHRRIRLGLALIPIVAWLVVVSTRYAIDNSTAGRLDRSGHIKGHDFIHFYVLGEIARDRAALQLYDIDAQSARNDRLVPEYPVRYLPIHAPQVALFFAPLATIPYLTALTIWLVASIVLYATCCWLVASTLPNLKPYAWVVALCSVAFPGFYGLMAAGQTSAWALLWITLAYLALRRDRHFLSGLFFGAIAYKPTLGIVLPFALLYARDWRMMAGAAVSAAMQFAVGWEYFGTTAILEYVANLRNGVDQLDKLEAQPWQMHSLRALFANTLPWPSVAWALQIVTSVLVVAVAVRAWRSTAPLAVRYALLLIATVLVSPHVYTYELVILVPAYLVTAALAVERQAARRLLWPALYAAVLLPGLSVFAESTYIQWSVLANTWLMLVLWKVSLAPTPQHLQPAEASV